MKFIPEQPKSIEFNVPYFSDASAETGWQGMSTGKSVAQLKAEISTAVNRIGGQVMSFMHGQFEVGKHTRDGIVIKYSIGNGELIGEMKIAALPVKTDNRLKRSYETRRDRSFRMALYMTAIALNGARFLAKLSPGYIPLMPWMLDKSGQTISELWSQSNAAALLPSGDVEFKDGQNG